MLRTLKGYPVEDFRGIVVTAASAVFRNPYSGEVRLPESGMTRDVLDEAADQLGIDLGELTDKDTRRLAALLNDELQNTIFTKRQKNLTLEKLANDGLLEAAQYKIKDSKQLRQQAKELGLSVSDLLDAVKHPTSFQHLIADSPVAENAKQFSLFVKYKPDNRDVIWDLVLSMRENRNITAMWGWRVFRSDLSDVFDIRDGTPLDLLIAFVERFGLPISVSGSTWRKFILYERIPIIEGEDPTKILKIEVDPKAQFHQHMLFRINSSPPSIDVSLSFAIDRVEYKTALARHRSSSGE